MQNERTTPRNYGAKFTIFVGSSISLVVIIDSFHENYR